MNAQTKSWLFRQLSALMSWLVMGSTLVYVVWPNTVCLTRLLLCTAVISVVVALLNLGLSFHELRLQIKSLKALEVLRRENAAQKRMIQLHRNALNRMESLKVLQTRQLQRLRR